MSDQVETREVSSCAAIIVAAGSARRMGFDKLSADLLGKSVLQRSVEAFAACVEIQQIIVVSNEERFSRLEVGGLDVEVDFAEGGQERQDSVQQGLAALNSGISKVAVHDGARPLITPEQIARTFVEAGRCRAAASARMVTETLKRADHDDFAEQSVSRDQLWIMETPQTFDVKTLREAYRSVSEQGLTVTDEVSVVESIGVKTKLVKNKDLNPKLTFPEDFALAEILLKSRYEG